MEWVVVKTVNSPVAMYDFLHDRQLCQPVVVVCDVYHYDIIVNCVLLTSPSYKQLFQCVWLFYCWPSLVPLVEGSLFVVFPEVVTV